MDNFPANTSKVSPENKCDVCKDKLAGYYNSTWYIHVCSSECFKVFLTGYYKEIDDIALEIKNADELGDKEDGV